MNAKSLGLGITGLVLAVAGSSCRVDCKFERHIDAGKLGFRTEHCNGKIVACTNGSPECKDVMRIECEGYPVYEGPYTIDLNSSDTIIKYLATDWHGPDAPYIVTQVPAQDGDVVWGKEHHDHQDAEGTCKYDYNAN